MLTVLKFGGSSLATAEKIDNAARIAQKIAESGDKVVMVVSAKGDTTDDLLKQAAEVSTAPSGRELDVLLSVGEQVSMSLMAMHLNNIGIPAISLCGWQAGVFTDTDYNNARILEIHSERVSRELENGNVVIVAGFQGINQNGDITTIGRGGSDTSAVALAASLKADKCLIYTDVDGVYSADPRIVTDALRHDGICYDEMLEMASLGAGVLHNRSVELAKKTDTVIKVLCNSNSNGGTEVSCNAMESRRVTGVTCDKDTTLLEVYGTGISKLPKILEILADNGITSDMMTDIGERLGITVPSEKADKALQLLEDNREKLSFTKTNADSSFAKVSAVGCGLGGDPKVAARMLRAINDKGIDIKSVVAGEIKISALIPECSADEAVKAVHKEFFGK